MVVGVNGEGQPDGGISLSVGNQPIRDWVDQAISGVVPSGSYVVQVFDSAEGISDGHGVVVVEFFESQLVPHMAPDHRYYLRAGAHTAPAPHFVVEALYARRGLTTPVLRPLLRHKPGVPNVVQLGIVAASAAPALDVIIDLPEPPDFLRRGKQFTLKVAVIAPGYPFFFDLHVPTFGSVAPDPFSMSLDYKDAAGRGYRDDLEIDVESQLGPTLMSDRSTREIVSELDDIEKAVREVAKASQRNEQHLKDLVRKLK